MKLLVFDNYDSFTYNLVHLVKQVDESIEVDVFRNDELPLEKVKAQARKDRAWPAEKVKGEAKKDRAWPVERVKA